MQTAANFGLIDRKYEGEEKWGDKADTQWQRFRRYVNSLNSEGGQKERYKVLFLARRK